jgi:hypothetical protein
MFMREVGRFCSGDAAGRARGNAAEGVLSAQFSVLRGSVRVLLAELEVIVLVLRPRSEAISKVERMAHCPSSVRFSIFEDEDEDDSSRSQPSYFSSASEN